VSFQKRASSSLSCQCPSMAQVRLCFDCSPWLQRFLVYSTSGCKCHECTCKETNKREQDKLAMAKATIFPFAFVWMFHNHCFNFVNFEIKLLWRLKIVENTSLCRLPIVEQKVVMINFSKIPMLFTSIYVTFSQSQG
jgi:hypothetical protein